ncbi:MULTISPECIES: helix-turn-helix domain-containing protein [Nocardiopsis]|jgi:MerR family copper efflux transcriptional regulator|uniref:MerR family transcriptional regulator n=2 Tax=Nocardiopsis alba TaxID=53437 RepID=A0A7K2IPV5_9ACTN|nr:MULTISPECIES: MerR family transcriptional regulator [Nocardiopsis]AFR09658.1 merR HTH regulatory family protein [Nocardiopsis alba ATCC BAA-2165]MEC3893100.1 MerR family transcriptional regulator [Nocardiopsis sp. LDBS1602]MYR32001.1 MerR family transcriptional regulator [Nocardiopsis alba]
MAARDDVFTASGTESAPVPISAAAERVGGTARMLRYREALGLLPRTQDPPTGRGHRHRRFTEEDLRTIEVGLELEREFDIPPAALSFALRVLAEPEVLARVRAHGERLGRLTAAPTRALDFEKEKAMRLLRTRRPVPPSASNVPKTP